MLDPYIYPGTSVLVNKLDIKDGKTLAIVEGRLFVLKSLESLPVGQFDYDHLKAIHHHFFSDLYDWAGQERTVNLAKENSYFAHVPFISPTISKQLNQLREEHYLRDLPPSVFCDRLSYYFNEINAVHPFREGNGRVQRVFCSLLGEQAGYYVDWKRLGERKEAYMRANIEGFLQGNYVPMAQLLRQITSPINASRQLALFGTKMSEGTILQLEAYVNKEVYLTELVQQRHRYLMTDTSLAKQLGQQAIALSKEIDEIANHLLSLPEIMSLLKAQAILPLTARGGFLAIRERWKKNERIDQDILGVLQYARRRLNQNEQVHHQDQDRSRKR